MGSCTALVIQQILISFIVWDVVSYAALVIVVKFPDIQYMVLCQVSLKTTIPWFISRTGQVLKRIQYQASGER